MASDRDTRNDASRERVAAVHGAFANRVRRPLREVMAEYDEDERRADERAPRAAPAE